MQGTVAEAPAAAAGDGEGGVETTELVAGGREGSLSSGLVGQLGLEIRAPIRARGGLTGDHRDRAPSAVNRRAAAAAMPVAPVTRQVRPASRSCLDIRRDHATAARMRRRHEGGSDGAVHGQRERQDPYKNFKFRVRWDGRIVAGVSKVSALKRTTEVVQYRSGTDPR